MITIEEDKKVLRNAYRKYETCCKCKRPNKNKLPMEIRTEISTSADNVIRFLSNPLYLESLKSTALQNAKVTYGRYCRVKKYDPSYISHWLEEKMNTLLDLMVDQDAREIHYVRAGIKGSEGVSLQPYFSDTQRIRSICLTTFLTTVEEYLSARTGKVSKIKSLKSLDNIAGSIPDEFHARELIIKSDKESELERRVWITYNGKKYHRSNCPFCKGRTVLATSYTYAVSSGRTPCKCEEATDRFKAREFLALDEKETVSESVMTAFVDESLRINPWYKYDASLNRNQMSYSYIVCKGWLNSEDDISPKNILYKNAALCEYQSTKMEEGTEEGILRVLMFLAFEKDFHNNVIIYTDNRSTVSRWRKHALNRGLSDQFDSIRVAFVPRTKNTKADAVGRERAFLDVPAPLMEQADKWINKGRIASNYMKQIRPYFDNPETDIPDLITSLMEIAGISDYWEILSLPDLDNQRFTKVIPQLLKIIKENQNPQVNSVVNDASGSQPGMVSFIHGLADIMKNSEHPGVATL